MIVDLSTIESKEIIEGLSAKFVHSENMTMAFWTIKAGASLPEHSHPHEQVSNLLQGEFELTIDGVPTRLQPGKVVIIAGDQPHSGRAITDCEILDIFHPVREDYK